VSQAAWSNWEHGEIPRDQATIVNKITEATGYRRDWLMWGDPAPDEPNERERR